MSWSLYNIGFIILFILIFLILLDIIFNFIKKYKLRHKVYEKLDSLCNNKLSKLTVCKNKPMDYILEIKNNIYLIKLLPNFKNNELIIYSENKILFRNQKGISKNINLDELRNFKYEAPTKKVVKKLVIIFPDCLNMVNYKTEFDIEYIHDELEVYGLYFMSANNLLSKEDLVG